MIKFFLFLYLIISSSLCFSDDTLGTPQTISTNELVDFQTNPSKVKKLIELGLELTKQKIAYQYGSSNPGLGGMDCSGTIYYLLTKLGVNSVPRSSNDLYNWVNTKGVLYTGNQDLTHLHPGDLLFWTNTYSAPNNAYITHAMIYIGKNRNGNRIMLGSSNGRTYQGKKIFGVSVFDFLPTTSNNKFVGYSCIPQVNCSPTPPIIQKINQ
jgi:hypothetical protein